ncbi:hypothetical protein CCR75_009201 [Bremia lactucae]|uniref:Uncharacterized protein n=1 Tax=Bremia lactucae TaxID=4779 RepID=A0A976FJK3_BRELC|nr:hypothetical protein CCR75_009201 [Bremia lactucae]
MWKPGDDQPQKEVVANSFNEKSSATKDVKTPKCNVPKSSAKLSQKTLAMKFMQRKRTTDAYRIAAVREKHWNDTWEAAPGNGNQDDDSSNISCERDVPDPSLPSLFGRRSFGGFNKGVEDEFKEASRALRFAASEEKELREEVSAEEMTARMLKYTGLGRRCVGERRPKSNKRQRK